MPWAGSTRKDTLPQDWKQRHAAVMRRDRYQCQWVREDTGTKCLAHANQCDHINDRWDHSLTNLQALCEYHHTVKSSSQGGTAAAKNRAKKKDAARKRHPGIID